MNRTRIAGLSLLLVLMFSTNCFAKTEIQELKIHEIDKTIPIENKLEYENNIKNEITVDGIKYQLKDVKTHENKATVTRSKEEKEQKIVTTGDKYNVLNLFQKSKQVGEDDYTGILELQMDSLDLQVNNSYIEQYKVMLKKEYNNVPENELNNIPKTIEENGTTYYLINPVWNISQIQKIDGQDIPCIYNGIMNYEGIKERRIINNYMATVTYSGILQKEETDSISFHLTYEEIPTEEKTDYTIPIATTTATGIVVFSGIIIYRRKNVYIYNDKNGRWKLVKKLHLNENERLIDITPITPSVSRKYRIVLSNKLYNDLLHSNITIKYFDKQYICEIKEKEFEILV